jgi:hypothetical protein
MNGHEQALPDEAGPASCTTRFTKQFKRLVNFLNLRKKLQTIPLAHFWHREIDP